VGILSCGLTFSSSDRVDGHQPDVALRIERPPAPSSLYVLVPYNGGILSPMGAVKNKQHNTRATRPNDLKARFPQQNNPPVNH